MRGAVVNRFFHTSSIVLIALGATLIHLAVIHARDDAWSFTFLSLWRQGRTTVLTSSNSEVDALFERLAADGNVLFTVDRCGTATPLQLQILSRYYYRGSYAVYPRRVYIADERTPLFGDSMFQSGFAPGPDWMNRHHVTTIVTMTCEGRAEVRISSAPRAATP